MAPWRARMAAAAERFVQLPGVRLYTRTVGRGEPLLVLHRGPALSHAYLFPGLSPLADVAKVTQWVNRLKGIGLVNSRFLVAGAFTAAFGAAA